MDTSNYKIYLCKKFMDNNSCNYDKEKCKFAHGEDDLYCKFKGNCKNENCDRIHLINGQRYIKYISKKSEKTNTNDNYDKNIEIVINELRKEFNERINKIELEIKQMQIKNISGTEKNMKS